jgi:hypothetical protein
VEICKEVRNPTIALAELEHQFSVLSCQPFRWLFVLTADY